MQHCMRMYVRLCNSNCMSEHSAKYAHKLIVNMLMCVHIYTSMHSNIVVGNIVMNLFSLQFVVVGLFIMITVR